MLELASSSVAGLQLPYLRYLGHHGPLADAMSLGAGDVSLHHPSLLPDSLPPPELQELQDTLFRALPSFHTHFSPIEAINF